MFVNFEDSDREKTIIINRFDSKCGKCGKSATIEDGYHKTVYGYGPENGTDGCGAVWEYIDSDYTGISHLLEEKYPQYKIVKRELI